MKEYVISESEAGRRLDKYVMNILRNSPSSFIYKMLRKKNIVLNDKKASGNELVNPGDVIRIYLSDETFDKFSSIDNKNSIDSDLSDRMPPVIYEDEDVLIVDKPAGMLTQRSTTSDISLNEICLSYVKNHMSRDTDNPSAFTPSVCNRLDRNTSGIVTFAKTYKGAKNLSAGFKDHGFEKYYRCIVVGDAKDVDLSGKLIKDTDSNTVTVTDDGEGADIRTVVRKISGNGKLSYCEIRLITGKTHQIRAHLAHCGHPILGDPKYGDKIINDEYRKRYGIKSQMLVCCRLVIPDDFPLGGIAGKTFETQVPDAFIKVM